MRSRGVLTFGAPHEDLTGALRACNGDSDMGMNPHPHAYVRYLHDMERGLHRKAEALRNDELRKVHAELSSMPQDGIVRYSLTLIEQRLKKAGLDSGSSVGIV